MILNGKKVNIRSVYFEGIDSKDHPDYVDSFISYAEFENGTALTEEECETLMELYPEELYDIMWDQMY